MRRAAYVYHNEEIQTMAVPNEVAVVNTVHFKTPFDVSRLKAIVPSGRFPLFFYGVFCIFGISSAFVVGSTLSHLK